MEIELRCLSEYLDGSISNLLSVLLTELSLHESGENLTEVTQSPLLTDRQGVRGDKFWDKGHHLFEIPFHHIPRSQQ